MGCSPGHLGRHPLKRQLRLRVRAGLKRGFGLTPMVPRPGKSGLGSLGTRLSAVAMTRSLHADILAAEK